MYRRVARAPRPVQHPLHPPSPARQLSGYDEDARSAASVQVQKMLCSPATLRKTRRSLKQLLEELAEEFAGLECVCQRLEADMGRAEGSVDRCRLEEQIGRLETMMEERRRQVCCLLKLYKQVRQLGQPGRSAVYFKLYKQVRQPDRSAVCSNCTNR